MEKQKYNFDSLLFYGAEIIQLTTEHNEAVDRAELLAYKNFYYGINLPDTKVNLVKNTGFKSWFKPYIYIPNSEILEFKRPELLVDYPIITDFLKEEIKVFKALCSAYKLTIPKIELENNKFGYIENNIKNSIASGAKKDYFFERKEIFQNNLVEEFLSRFDDYPEKITLNDIVETLFSRSYLLEDIAFNALSSFIFNTGTYGLTTPYRVFDHSTKSIYHKYNKRTKELAKLIFCFDLQTSFTLEELVLSNGSLVDIDELFVEKM